MSAKQKPPSRFRFYHKNSDEISANARILNEEDLESPGVILRLPPKSVHSDIDYYVVAIPMSVLTTARANHVLSYVAQQYHKVANREKSVNFFQYMQTRGQNPFYTTSDVMDLRHIVEQIQEYKKDKHRKHRIEIHQQRKQSRKEKKDKWVQKAKKSNVNKVYAWMPEWEQKKAKVQKMFPYL